MDKGLLWLIIIVFCFMYSGYQLGKYFSDLKNDSASKVGMVGPVSLVFDPTNCEIVYFSRNDFGDNFEKAFREGWRRCGFQGHKYKDLKQYEKGQMNGFCIGYTQCWRDTKMKIKPPPEAVGGIKPPPESFGGGYQPTKDIANPKPPPAKEAAGQE